MRYTLVERRYEVVVRSHGAETITEMDQFEIKSFEELEEAKMELEKDEYEPEIETLNFGKKYEVKDYAIVWVDEDGDWEVEERENIYELVEELADSQLDARIDADDAEYAIGKKTLKEELAVAVEYDNAEDYKDAQGWQDWMNEFTKAEDGEEPDEAEMNEIEEIQNKIFNASRCEDINMLYQISKAKKKADEKWKKENIKQVKFGFNVKTDEDILKKLNSVDNKIDYIRELIRNDIEKPQ